MICLKSCHCRSSVARTRSGAEPAFQLPSTFVSSTWRRQDSKLSPVWNFRHTDSEYQFPGNLLTNYVHLDFVSVAFTTIIS